MKITRTLLAIFVLTFVSAGISHAQKTAAMILREGLLGAGAGAIGGAVSGGKSDNLWISALTGAGVNIVGGSVLDVISDSNKPAQRTAYYAPQPAATYYAPVQRVPGRRNYYSPNVDRWYHIEEIIPDRGYTGDFKRVYIEGFKDGYKEGYRQAVSEYEGF